ncbi:MAG TPA: 1,2-phenylacetyl-CoA epoxidase subunit PaaD [Gemmatimonadaceae bacterium]|nr:1,2-phenylacetyl-CoA epoxidase subunit PaaD [Gemmatimonadaceae bacterium]
MVTVADSRREQILAWLEEVKDPEVPVLSIRELGVLRDVELDGDEVMVVLTPTYSGCPAMRVMEDEVVQALHRRGIERVSVRTVYSPAWTTDWMSAESKAKLEAYGIAPPGRVEQDDLVPLRRRKPVPCPYCKSVNTTMRSEFGSTACKAILFCNACHQPFELFKAI